MRDAFLINLNEANSSNFKGIMGRVRGMITEDKFDLRAMQQGTISLPSFHRFCLMTNADYPIPTTQRDRRFGIMKASNELIDNDEYFADLRNNVIYNENCMRTFWDYLSARQVNAKMTKHDLPETEYHRELKKANAHPIMQWVEHITLESKSSDTSFVIDNATAWESYKSFCNDSNIQLNNTTKRGFETSLGIKNIPGVSKKQSTNGRARVFDLTALREHFEIETVEYIEVDDPE